MRFTTRGLARGHCLLGCLITSGATADAPMGLGILQGLCKP
jgi:hypothetical protein